MKPVQFGQTIGNKIMQINKHIALLAEELSLYSYETELLQHVWNNRKKRDSICVNIANVSSSGMSRQFKVMVHYKGQFANITPLIAKVTRTTYNQNKATVSRSGCGMDMGFALLEGFFSYLIPVNQKVFAHQFSAVQHYFYL